MKGICKRYCELERAGTRQCCYYCDFKNSCENPCEGTPYKCNEMVADDSELLDYVLDKWLNMNKIELIEHYLDYIK
jgi:hypothetical protein